MNILAIESSCDETSAAILHTDLPYPSNNDPLPTKLLGNNQTLTHFQLLSNVVVSQIDIFAAYGGVIPEIAARSHLEAILPVIHQAFQEANLTLKEASQNPATPVNLNASTYPQNISTNTPDWSKIDAIAVTHTPGLLGSLLIGTLTARTLAVLHNKPLYPIHHLKSHIYSAWLPTPENSSTPPNRSDFCREGAIFKEAGVAQRTALTVRRASNAPADAEDDPLSAKPLVNNQTTPTFPIIALVVSGGHTQLIHLPTPNHFQIIGTTRDDAVGECFDKVAKILGLPYPGGPAIAQAAAGQIPPEILSQYAQSPQSEHTSNRPSSQNFAPSPASTPDTTTPPSPTSVATTISATASSPLRPGDPHKYHLPHPHLTVPNRHSTPTNRSDFCREGAIFKEAGVTQRTALTVRRASNAPADAEDDPLSAKPLDSNISLDFSFSGLKTATLRLIQKTAHRPISFPSHQLAPLLTPQQVADLAASFQQTAVEILLKNLEKSTQLYPCNSLVIAGGVSANRLLREKAQALSDKLKIPIHFPAPAFSGDNAAMVAIAALFEIFPTLAEVPTPVNSPSHHKSTPVNSPSPIETSTHTSPTEISTHPTPAEPLTPTPPTDPYTVNILPRSPIS